MCFKFGIDVTLIADRGELLAAFPKNQSPTSRCGRLLPAFGGTLPSTSRELCPHIDTAAPTRTRFERGARTTRPACHPRRKTAGSNEVLPAVVLSAWLVDVTRGGRCPDAATQPRVSPTRGRAYSSTTPRPRGDPTPTLFVDAPIYAPDEQITNGEISKSPRPGAKAGAGG